jgi:cysteine desulfurase
MSIYLDYAAATPLDGRVLTAMQPYFSEQFYNPSSPYLAARQVRADIEAARGRIARWLGVKPAEVIFTAGATESINLAIHGVMQKFPGRLVVYGAIEHDAVRQSAARYNHTVVPVLPDGTIDLAKLRAAITNETVLVSIGYANNEIGTIQPLKEIAHILTAIRAERTRSGNRLPLYFHTDASQAAGYLDLSAHRLGVDLMTLNGGKIYGPKQSGILFIKAGTQLDSFMTGGGQEGGIRGGTENTAVIVGFATALDLAQTDRKATAAKQATLRDELERQLCEALPQAVVNGNHKRRLPGSLHISWPGIDGERLVMLLDERGVQAATGSACAANKQTASHVLQAIGLDEAYVQGSLRLSLGTATTLADISRAANIIVECVRRLRG